MSKPVRYYHGGVPDLLPGRMILPPVTTGVRSCALYGASGVCDPQMVYVTTDIEAAMLFAAGHPSNRGAVYLVKPDEPLLHDPDCRQPGLSFACPRAKVIRRIRIKNKIMRKARKALFEIAET
ncbi:hypothetical protein [Roseovarius sp. MMSF_3281]|uniref:hypothetical protein n=1 Tax=Roseovarius sp. MMSF_3281 TaxID=3046694 RepID=UPI00273E7A35|nr:hypothetical protein [Roseovarius sp. MMSF_3281]